ncbi:MAG: hypothetical protein JWM18_1237 [Chloroflexi bacterium]|jgi:hypothetical protein|nr:hypothetical protein [Chloroflexota bacterium]
MRHTKTKAERLLRAVEKREQREAKRALRRQLKAERRAGHRVSSGPDPTI